MKKDELIELINARIDGEISREQNEALEKELKENQAARQYFDEISGVVDMLKKDSEKKEDIDFSGQIMNSIDKEKYSGSKSESSFWRIFNFSFSDNFRYAAVFSIGALVGLICYATLFKSGTQNFNPKDSEISGTMVDVSRPPNFNKGESVVIDNNGVKANINSYYQNDMIMAEVKVKSDENVSLNFSFNDQNLKVYALKSFNTKAESDIISSKGIVQIQSKGDNTFLMLFKNRNTEKEKIEIKVYSGISMIFNSRILAN
jgi:hypothetical protein